MSKNNFYFIALFLCFITSVYSGRSVFERSFNILHKEPHQPSIKGRSAILTKWIEQKVDNFNDSDTRTWKMRYMENGNNFENGGPIFIYVGGEWTISPSSISGGHVFDMAKKHKGFLFYTEHRYYGRSFPVENLMVENLKYLSVEQSLADLAHFIKTVKETYPGLSKSKVILVGGSYSATMVTWFQRLYPGLSVGSWASSAPVLAKVDFEEYKVITGESIALVGGKPCYKRIANAFQEMETLFYKNNTKIMKLFNVCDNFDATNKLDVWSFFSSLSDLFAGLVQTHNSGDIQYACKVINSKENGLEGVLSYISKILHGNECNDFSYKESVKSMSYTENSSSMMRQWFYQTCSEFGWYQTSAAKNQPFGKNFPVELYTQLCKDVYGERFSNKTIYENIIKTNNKFGGMSPNLTNVIWTHGQLDPWHGMGIQETNGVSNVIPLYAHCKDLASISDKDTKEMKASKQKVAKIVSEWLI